jgi:hypothetical protein
MNSIMKQTMLRLGAALSMALVVSLTAPNALAQGAKPGAAGQPTADQKAMADFTKKATEIQAKYMPKIQAIQKKYQPQMEAAQKKLKPIADKLQAKYKAEGDALQNEAKTIKPEEQQGPKGQAFLKKVAAFQNKMKADPEAKKIEAEVKPIQAKMNAEVKPIAKKFGDEILAAAPAKMKAEVKKKIDEQMKMLGG